TSPLGGEEANVPTRPFGPTSPLCGEEANVPTRPFGPTSPLGGEGPPSHESSRSGAVWAIWRAVRARDSHGRARGAGGPVARGEGRPAVPARARRPSARLRGQADSALRGDAARRALRRCAHPPHARGPVP